MSNQVLTTQRFKKRASGPTENRLMPKRPKNSEHPVSSRRRSTQVQNASLGATVHIEPSLVDLVENFFLKIDVSAPATGGAFGNNFGSRLIKSVTVRSGGQQLMHYPHFYAWVAWSLSKVDKQRCERIKQNCLGNSGSSAQTLYIPMPYPGCPFGRKDWRKCAPLALAALNSKRPITFEVEFETAANICSTAFSITSCKIEYDEIIVPNPNKYRGRVNIYQEDIKQLPAQITLGAGTQVETVGIEALQGAIKEIHLVTTAAAAQNAESNPLDLTTLSEMSVVLDGEEFKECEDQQRNRIDSMMAGHRVQDEVDSGCNFISFTRHADDDFDEAVLHTDGARRISVKSKADAASVAVLQTVQRREIYSSGNGLKVRDL